MLQPFNIETLLLPTSTILLVTLLLSLIVTRSFFLSIITALIKTSIFFIYFAVLFDGTHTFLDDWSYLAGGKKLVDAGVGLFNIGENWTLLFSVGNGDHFFYYLYNAWAFYLFGESYYAPVALNVIISLLIAWLGANLARKEFGYHKQKRKLFFIFLALHPDILAWSSVMNGKDILVLFLQIILLWSAAQYYRNMKAKALIAMLAASSILIFLRFYIPLIFSLAFATYSLIHRKNKHWLQTIAGGALVITTTTWLEQDHLEYALASLNEHFTFPVTGLIRFVLTPIPFNTEIAYSFLDIPACIHWLLFPFSLVGLLHVINFRTPFSRFFLIYLFILLGLYSSFDALQGPRHRVQIDYALAVFQFSGVNLFLKYIFKLDLKSKKIESHNT